MSVKVRAVHIRVENNGLFYLGRESVLCGAWVWSDDNLRIVAADDPRATCRTCLKIAGRGGKIPFWGVSQDREGVWHVWSDAEEILSTGDREYAIRALMRALEREVARGTEVS